MFQRKCLTHHSYLFSFLLYYPFFEKDMPLHLNKIENPLPMNALCVKIFIPSKKTWSFIFQTCFLFSKNWFLESSADLSFCIILNDTILCLWSLSYCNVGKNMHTLWIFFCIKSYTALQLKKNLIIGVIKFSYIRVTFKLIICLCVLFIQLNPFIIRCRIWSSF